MSAVAAVTAASDAAPSLDAVARMLTFNSPSPPLLPCVTGTECLFDGRSIGAAKTASTAAGAADRVQQY
ncbi:hypothetical protein GCM10010486_43680 [Nonomuraea roseoviolacea subsp. carminata]